jgi:hypothetical protein
MRGQVAGSRGREEWLERRESREWRGGCAVVRGAWDDGLVHVPRELVDLEGQYWRREWRCGNGKSGDAAKYSEVR